MLPRAPGLQFLMDYYMQIIRLLGDKEDFVRKKRRLSSKRLENQIEVT
jgi:hypothetical protein